MAVFLNSFLPDSDADSKLQLVDEGLDKLGTEADSSPYKLINQADIATILKPRRAFSHKGTYGHALLIAGDIKTMGAALLCASGCLYGGAGLTTLSVPESGLTALNSVLPEVMYLERKQLVKIKSLKKYNAIAIGPGLGKHLEVIGIIEELVTLKVPVVADADALNILSKRADLLFHLAKNSIFTPHLKEFDTLFGKHKNWWERLQTARTMAKKLGAVIVLKNQFTFIVDQEGDVLINPTGNPAMAQGGMGDVLTGLIAAYVAQGYSAKAAALLGCYFHGKAGDELAVDHHNITASSLAAQLPLSVKRFLR
ncbi:NAD(P)H-hydrate dehydratase [Pedobacter africanus]|uniref:ADP-dependent (S)-NAD(P)H-hydrate dehydratase n=1 Tax=Pedobacter africanus TaxID=151894 RepID=A0A1W2ALJ7_9SPHI|nr:NAD(P)H-hydrate dehydratase [Pedobacter africanus]SMC61577.1 yjeF C-terminal region, hydroxyethylthiazole kinase-related [Pedobacter africanus]